MTICTRKEAIRIFDDIVTDYQMPVGSQRINRLRSYIESHTGEAVCPRSANGRPESFTVTECVAAGECGCGESVTPGSTVRVSPVQPVLEWRDDLLFFNDKEIGGAALTGGYSQFELMGEWYQTLYTTLSAAKAALESAARQWLSGGDK